MDNYRDDVELSPEELAKHIAESMTEDDIQLCDLIFQVSASEMARKKAAIYAV